MGEKSKNDRINIKLRDARNRRLWTQKKVAEMLGVTDLTVGRWERGEVAPSMYYAKKLCELFEATPEELGLVQREKLDDDLQEMAIKAQELPAEGQEERSGKETLAPVTETEGAQEPVAPRWRLSRRALLLGIAGTTIIGGGIGGFTILSHHTSSVTDARKIPSVPAFLTYTGHSKPVWGVTWSPDSQYIASTGNDQTVQVWDANTGRLHFRYAFNSGEIIRCVAWSPDGKYLASGCSYGSVQVRLAVAAESFMRNVKQHEDDIRSVAWSPDSQCLASGSFDQTVQVRSVSTWALRFSVNQNVGAIWSVAWSPDGKYLAIGSADRHVYICESVQGKILLKYSDHSAEVSSVAWSPDGKYLASGSFDQTVQVHRIILDQGRATLAQTYRGHSDQVHSVAWSSDGHYIASGGANAHDATALRVWRALTGEEMCLEFSGSVRTVAWSREHKWLATASYDKEVRVWHLGGILPGS